MERREVRLRLVRSSELPPSHSLDEQFVFGLQNNKQQIAPPTVQADGTLACDFTLMAGPGRDAVHPNFTGRFASGPVDDRFVYLAWRSVPRGVFINRVKARLAGIDWALIEAAAAAGRPIVADMTGWVPGDKRKQVAWHIAERE